MKYSDFKQNVHYSSYAKYNIFLKETSKVLD